MKISTFSFDLPDELIAQFPSKERGDDRLLVIDRETGKYTDSVFKALPDFMDEGSLLVINNTRVRKARIYGVTDTGGKVEFLLTDRISDNSFKAIVSKSKRQYIGRNYLFYDKDGNFFCSGKITGEEAGGIRTISFSISVDEIFFEKIGHVPLPPYIRRDDLSSDEERYQTIYARQYGSLACPTAGLHFTPEIFDRIREKNIEVKEITLNVGLGTFLPVRTENLEDHKMHSESYFISEETASAVNRAKKAQRKIIAVGTTCMRTLESAFNQNTGLVESGENSTALFIKPGFSFNVVDQLVTNFHTPESTLLVLVSAFAGTEHILNAYKHAVNERYKFFSYGDVTFLK